MLCPLWGVLSDKIGTRPVAVSGIFLVGICLFVYTTAKNVYPGLLLLRLFFAVGASASASMITAILSEISTFRVQPGKLLRNVVDQLKTKIQNLRGVGRPPLEHHDYSPARTEAISSENGTQDSSILVPHDQQPFLDETEIGGFRDNSDDDADDDNADLAASAAIEDGREFADDSDEGIMQVVEPGRRNGTSAALVGVSTGLGACFAVFVLLSLPITLDKKHEDPARALKISYYIVASIAIFISGVLFLGLHKDRTKSIRYWIRGGMSEFDKAALNIVDSAVHEETSYFGLLKTGFSIAMTEKQIALAYMGGFVARSTTVATVMFIPLAINVYFRKVGKCSGNLHDPTSELKKSCPEAYLISVIVTGICQTTALVFAPFWGFTSNKFGRKATLLCSGIIGFVGFLGFGCLTDPTSSAAVYVFGAMMGVAQIGTIIASMSLCTDTKRAASGTIAGVYSFCGGVGILILSKLGGWLSDVWAGAPFIILACFYVALILMTISQMPDQFGTLLDWLHLRKTGQIRLDDTDETY